MIRYLNNNESETMFKLLDYMEWELNRVIKSHAIDLDDFLQIILRNYGINDELIFDTISDSISISMGMW